MRTVDLDSCAREPIHIPGLIQPHGVLLLLEPHTERPIVRVVSSNSGALLGVAPEGLVGRGLDAVLRPEDAAEVARRLATGRLHLHPIYIHAARALHGDAVFNAVAHRLESWIVLELEPALPGESASAGDLHLRLQSAMVDLRQPAPVKDLCERLAKHVREINGFDRVMVYRFDREWNGEVIAEERRENLEPFLGLHYPAADIPEQARSLYTRNWLRFIADRSYEPAGLAPGPFLPGTDRPLDMSHCVLRSVSPIHLEYLANMGVGASMSISLIRDGRLWGLIACHHYEARRVPYDVRAACELIGQVVSLQLAEWERAEMAGRLEAKSRQIPALIQRLRPGPDFADSLRDQAPDVLGLVRADGLAILMDDAVVRLGQTPPDAMVRAIAERVGDTEEEPYFTDRLGEELGGGWSSPEVSGVLGASLAKAGVRCVLWFRGEQVRVVDWAGDPAKSVVKGEAPARLSPRGSFALWKETVRGRSQPWADDERMVAAEFRRALLRRLVEHASDVMSHNRVLRAASEAKDQILDSERAARAQAERINRMTDEFVATLSHELRTPLNAIQGWVHLLRSGSAEIDLAEALDVIDRNVRVQTQMVNDLLDTSRINSGKLRLNVRRVSLPGVVDEALGTVRFAAEAKNIRLVKSIEPMPGVEMLGDPQRLQQVVWNLLSNAVKFTPAGGEVSVTLRRDKSMLELTVRDTGAGIAPEFLPYVFDRFRQADAAITRSFGGLGLGLSIVRHLTELHGGTVQVESEGLGKGACFTVRFPVKSEGEGPGDAPKDALGADLLALQGLGVLVLEDEPDARRFVKGLLADHGVEVRTAALTAEALVAARERVFDLVISDIGLPGEDGFAFIRQLRQLEAEEGRARTPAIALTAYARAEDRWRIMLAGFQNHVAKPVEPSELLAVIANLTERI